MALHSRYTKYKPTTNGYNDIQVAIMKRAASPPMADQVFVFLAWGTSLVEAAQHGSHS